MNLLPLANKTFFSVTESEQNWEAVDGSQTEAEKKHFFINVCHRVLREGKAINCSEDAAVCAVGEWCWWEDWGRLPMWDDLENRLVFHLGLPFLSITNEDGKKSF